MKDKLAVLRDRLVSKGADQDKSYGNALFWFRVLELVAVLLGLLFLLMEMRDRDTQLQQQIAALELQSEANNIQRETIEIMRVQTDQLRQQAIAQARTILENARGKKGDHGQISSIRTLVSFGVPMVRADFSKLDLTGMDVSCNRRQPSGLALRGWLLDPPNCLKLEGANFSDSRLVNARLNGLDLVGANFRGADLSGANMAFTLLHGAHWGESESLVSTKFRNTDFTNTMFVDPVFADRIDFEATGLGGLDFSGSVYCGESPIGLEEAGVDPRAIAEGSKEHCDAMHMAPVYDEMSRELFDMLSSDTDS